MKLVELRKGTRATLRVNAMLVSANAAGKTAAYVIIVSNNRHSFEGTCMASSHGLKTELPFAATVALETTVAIDVIIDIDYALQRYTPNGAVD